MINIAKEPHGTQMDHDKLAQLWVEWPSNASNEALRNRLVEVYLPLVKDHAERVWTRLPESVELDDLVSAGTFGLIDAVESFDPERGVKFEHFCVPRIRGAMSMTVKLLRLDERRHASRQCSRARPTGPLEDPTAELCDPCLQQGSFLPHFAKSLNRTERLVVILLCFEGLTLKEIGQTLDLPETGVEQIIRSLQQRLRHDEA